MHVDGAHDLAGCAHDLRLALTLNPEWILVDDLVHHPESCNIAAHEFVREYGFAHLVLATTRGDMLIRVRR